MDQGTGTLLASIVTAGVAIFIAWQNARQNTALKSIHIMVNSNLNSVKEDLEVALERVRLLEELLRDEFRQKEA